MGLVFLALLATGLQTAPPPQFDFGPQLQACTNYQPLRDAYDRTQLPGQGEQEVRAAAQELASQAHDCGKASTTSFDLMGWAYLLESEANVRGVDPMNEIDSRVIAVSYALQKQISSAFSSRDADLAKASDTASQRTQQVYTVYYGTEVTEDSSYPHY